MSTGQTRQYNFFPSAWRRNVHAGASAAVRVGVAEPTHLTRRPRDGRSARLQRQDLLRAQQGEGDTVRET
jgi:hypothetical protein